MSALHVLKYNNRLVIGATANLYCEYPKDAFQILIRNQCPAADPLCVIDVPFDVSGSLRYRCALG